MHCCSSLQHITSRTARRPHHAARRQPVRGVALSPALAHRPQQWGSLQSLAASRSTSNNSSTSTAASSSTDDSSTLTAAEAAAQRYGWSFPSQDHHHNQQQDPRIQEIPVAAIRRPLGRTRANGEGGRFEGGGADAVPRPGLPSLPACHETTTPYGLLLAALRARPSPPVGRSVGRLVTNHTDQAKVEALMESIREIGLQEPVSSSRGWALDEE